ncbi:MAG TPA: glycosyltransferase family 4 protein [Isosphaeraceae bacterium]
MTEPVRHVVLIADRIVTPDQAGTIRAFVERLGHRGLAARILCSAWKAPSRGGLDVEESAGLARPLWLSWGLRSLRRPEGTSRPALLHALQARMAPAALELAERWQIPYIQGVEEFLPPGSRLRLSQRWCRGLVATSRELGEDLTRGFGVPGDRVHVIHRGLEVAESVTSRWATGPSPVSVIGAAGPLVHASGFTTFLNAARRVLDAGVDAEFVLVGEGEEEGDLRRRADRLRLAERLTFAGEAAVGMSFWNVLDVYCQPSTTPTVGRDLARAMAHGIPPVASDIEGLRSLVTHGVTGLRVPPSDTNALARAMLDLLADRPRAARLGLDAREAVLRDYDLDREADLLSKVYRGIIDSERPAETVTLSMT